MLFYFDITKLSNCFGTNSSNSVGNCFQGKHSKKQANIRSKMQPNDEVQRRILEKKANDSSSTVEKI